MASRNLEPQMIAGHCTRACCTEVVHLCPEAQATNMCNTPLVSTRATRDWLTKAVNQSEICPRHFKARVCTRISGTLWARWTHRWNQHGCPERIRLEHLRLQRNLREAFKTHAELLRLPNLKLLAVEKLPPKLLTAETTG